MFLFRKREKLKYFFVFIDIIFYLLIVGISLTVFINLKKNIVDNYDYYNHRIAEDILKEVVERVELFHLILDTINNTDEINLYKSDFVKYINAIYSINREGEVEFIVPDGSQLVIDKDKILNSGFDDIEYIYGRIYNSPVNDKPVYLIVRDFNSKRYIFEVDLSIFFPRKRMDTIFMLADKEVFRYFIQAEDNLIKQIDIVLNDEIVSVNEEKYKFKEVSFNHSGITGFHLYPVEDINRIVITVFNFFISALAVLLIFLAIKNYYLITQSYKVFKTFKNAIVSNPESPVNLDTNFDEWREIEYYYNRNIDDRLKEFNKLNREIDSRKNIEEGIISGEKKFNLLIDQMQEGVLLCDCNDLIVNVNKEFARFVGKNGVDLVLKKYYDSSLGFVDEDRVKIDYRNHPFTIVKESMAPYKNRILGLYNYESADYHWFQVSSTPVINGKNIDYIIGTFTDVTELKRFNVEINEALKEKEILIKEIHHRVKNNLQVISSIINIQLSYSDPQSGSNLGILKNIRDRIRSMAMIHEQLYNFDRLSEIDFYEYLNNLTGFLLNSYQEERAKVNINVDCVGIILDLERSIPCGIIINEVVSNSLKYAFKNKSDGLIKIIFKKTETGYSLTIRDNGAGYPEDFDPNSSSTFGIKLIKTLSAQLDGELTIKNDNGAYFNLVFD